MLFRRSLVLLAAVCLAAAAVARDAARPKPAVTLKSRLPSKSYRQFRFGPDGRTLAVAYADRTLRIWDAATGELKATLAGEVAWDSDISWSPDGSRLLTSNSWKPERFSVWDARTGALVSSPVFGKELRKHGKEIRRPAWSPDGRTILTTVGGKFVQLIDAATGQARVTITSQADVRAALSPDGGTVLTFGRWAEAKLWDATSGELRATLAPTGKRLENVLSGARFSPDGRLLAAEALTGDFYLFALPAGRLIGKFAQTGFRNSTILGGFSPDGRWLVTMSCKGFFSPDCWAELRDPATGEVRRELRAENFGSPNFVWSADGDVAATASNPRGKYTAHVWEPATGRLLAALRLQGDRFLRSDWPDEIRLTPGGNVLMAAGDKSVRFWEARTGELLARDDEASFPLDLSADGRLAVSAAKNGREILVWEITGG